MHSNDPASPDATPTPQGFPKAVGRIIGGIFILLALALGIKAFTSNPDANAVAPYATNDPATQAAGAPVPAGQNPNQAQPAGVTVTPAAASESASKYGATKFNN